MTTNSESRKRLEEAAAEKTITPDDTVATSAGQDERGVVTDTDSTSPTDATCVPLATGSSRSDKIRQVAQQAHDNGDCVCCLPDPVTITISREDAARWASDDDHIHATAWGPVDEAIRAALEGGAMTRADKIRAAALDESSSGTCVNPGVSAPIVSPPIVSTTITPLTPWPRPQVRTSGALSASALRSTPIPGDIADGYTACKHGFTPECTFCWNERRRSNGQSTVDTAEAYRNGNASDITTTVAIQADEQPINPDSAPDHYERSDIDEWLDSLQKKHRLVESFGDTACPACAQWWPCDTAKLLGLISPRNETIPSDTISITISREDAEILIAGPKRYGQQFRIASMRELDAIRAALEGER